MGIGVGYTVRLAPAASQHAKKIRAYYRSINTRLAQRFQSELSAKLKSLQSFNAYAVRYDDVRSLFCSHFPYLLYFVVFEAEALVEVVAILHERQERD